MTRTYEPLLDHYIHESASLFNLIIYLRPYIYVHTPRSTNRTSHCKVMIYITPTSIVLLDLSYKYTTNSAGTDTTRNQYSHAYTEYVCVICILLY
jgi:hypothetical protein